MPTLRQRCAVDLHLGKFTDALWVALVGARDGTDARFESHQINGFDETIVCSASRPRETVGMITGWMMTGD
jgi:hypothetical protein